MSLGITFSLDRILVCYTCLYVNAFRLKCMEAYKNLNEDSTLLRVNKGRGFAVMEVPIILFSPDTPT